ncbi:hypothetical protein [Paenibacillus caui]|uniref:hypothetical protein n=1 Tax=Paenibacillus caui TaxID=2873927 RepID=UPI001CA94891|nr:hypothetical protein [Paenibacillus caui]
MFGRFFKRREPVSGSIIFTTLYGGLGESSGIYVGNQNVITLTYKGILQLITIEQFGKLHPTSFNSEIYAPYEITTRKPVSFPEAARRAQALLEGNESYKLMLINSHQFCSGCITGNFENEDVGLSELKQRIESCYPNRLDWFKQN